MTTRDFLKSLAASALGALGWASVPAKTEAPGRCTLHQYYERTVAILPDGRTVFCREGILTGSNVDGFREYVSWRIRPGCCRHFSRFHVSQDKTELHYRLVDIELPKV